MNRVRLKKVAVAAAVLCAGVLVLLAARWYRNRARVAAESVDRALRTRMAANEMKALASCKRIANAQVQYYGLDPDRDGVREYASFFTLLYSQKDRNGSEIALISPAVARATSPTNALDGYYFVDIRMDAGSGPYLDARGDQPYGFGICAVPAHYPVSGRRTFILDATRTLYQKDTGGRPVTVFPASPRAFGWSPVE